VRIAIVGFGAESSTFSLNKMTADNFPVLRGNELVGLYELDSWLPETKSIEWLPVLRAHGGAGGPVVAEVFDGFVSEIVGRLEAFGELDGLYIDLHGAAHVEGRGHAEEELLGRIRAVVGEGTVISMSMDTHGNFSRELAELVDLAVCFRHAPHVDAWDIRRRAIAKLVETLQRGERPLKAWVRVPLLLPGERTSTVVEPARTVFGSIGPMIERHGVFDASLWVGFAWADEDRNAAAVLVTGYDVSAVLACAEELARAYWDPREGFVIVAEHSGSWDEALDFALQRPATPFYISDSGDNVTAGGTGDVTHALTRTLKRADVAQLRILFASLTDPASVDAAQAAGIGAALSRGIGAAVDARHAPPVVRVWRVEMLFDGLYPGEGVVGVLLSAGNVHVIVKRSRTSFTDPDVSGKRTGRRLPGHVFLSPEGYDAVVVKNGYLFPDQAQAAASWFMALTPGGTDLDVGRLAFEKVQRPLYPLDRHFEADLTPVLLPSRA
jgi:microcystin degradation protein MlrC